MRLDGKVAIVTGGAHGMGEESTSLPGADVAPDRGARNSLVDERAVVKVGGRELVLLSPVVLGVLPFGLVASFRQQVHAAHQIARIEVLRIDPGQQRHILVLGSECRRHLPRVLFLHD